MAALVPVTARPQDSMLKKYANQARLAAQNVYGVKTANLDWLFNLSPEIVGALAPEDQYAIMHAKQLHIDENIRQQAMARKPPPDNSPVSVAESVLNSPNSSISHLVTPVDDKRYMVHRSPENETMRSFMVNVPDNVHDLPASKSLISKNVHSNALKGLGIGAIGGGALGAGLGALSTSEEGDEGTNTALGGTLGAIGGGALGSALGAGRGKQVGQNVALGGYIANQVRNMV